MHTWGLPCSPNYTLEEVLIYGTTPPANQGAPFFFHASWMQRKELPAGAPQWLLPKRVAVSLKGEGDGECFLWDEGASTPPPLLNPTLLVGIWGSTMKEGICEATSALHLRKACQQPESRGRWDGWGKLHFFRSLGSPDNEYSHTSPTF